MTSASTMRWSVPAFYFVGIVATFSRELVLAAKYGTGLQVEVFRLAFAVPNLMSTSLGPSFVAAVIPTLMSVESDSGRLASTARGIVMLNVLGVFSVTALGILTSPLQARLLAPGYGADLATDLSTYISLTWLFFLFAGCSFSLRALLSQRGVLWPASAATFIGAGTIVVGCLFASALPPDTFKWSAGLLVGLTVLSGVLILASHVLVTPRGVLGAGRINLADLPIAMWAVRGAGASIVAVAAYHLLSAVPRLIDRSVATTLGTGVVPALEYSFSLITVPGILLGTSLVTMLYPAFSRSVESGLRVPVRAFIRPVSIAIGLSAAAGLIMFAAAPTLVKLVYGHGAFGASSIRTTAVFVRWHGLGLPFMVATIILAQAALAFRQYRLVMSIAAVRIAAKAAAVALMVPAMGLSGLAASFILPEAVSAAILVVALRRHVSARTTESVSH